MYSLFVSAEGGGKAGLVYVFFRSMYPVMWSLKGGWNYRVELSLQPCYIVLNYIKVSLLWLLIFGTKFHMVVLLNI